MQIYNERQALEKREQVFLLEKEKKEILQKLMTTQNDKEQLVQKLELISSTKSNELQIEIEKLKLEH